MKTISLKKLLVITSLLLATGLFAQQNGTVMGTITDQELGQEPLLFANIELKNTELNVQTNFHGNFELKNVPVGQHTLVISYLGYDTLEVPIMVMENSIHKIEKSMTTVQFSFDDVAGMEKLLSGDETLLPSKEEKK